ncbi:Hypothetical protein EAG7_03321 [Klebsiella aerogenes]|nr:Hypothetical protein EAG7_03321 [Klebsiella aerogenes]PVF75217.1 putative membrane protein [Klebsiella aerogenes]CCG31812.1 hypothetical protein [Klebsiella aerogenes EA1509E]
MFLTNIKRLNKRGVNLMHLMYLKFFIYFIIHLLAQPFTI